MAETQVEDVGDFYEHEKLAATVVCKAVVNRYRQAGRSLGPADISSRSSFANEVKGRCADEGLVVEIDFEGEDPIDPSKPDEEPWMSPTVSDDPNDYNIYYCPRVRVVGRINKVAEFDHDRQKFEVRAGEFDGVKGVVDVNTGQLKEESKRKTIY
jgi:hypothetical protein